MTKIISDLKITFPLVSIIIATYNSEKTLHYVLKSVLKQSYPKKYTEIILVDGGSVDKTLEIARRYGCLVIHNPQVEPVFGKYLGYIKSKGRYVMYLDHDEVLLNRESIISKVDALEECSHAKVVAGGGYRSPKEYPLINDYINDFGDPFSFFIYRLSKRDKFFIRDMKKKYTLILEKNKYLLFDLSGIKSLPIIELVNVGSMFDASLLKKYFPETKVKMELLPHFFYLLYLKYPEVIVMKDDPILHYSVDTLKKYLIKISWRVKNNLYHVNNMGQSGFSGREKFQPAEFRLKKYLFIPYAFTLVFPFYDAIWLIITRKNIMYILHVPLTLYTASLIVFHLFLKKVGVTQPLKNYDESIIITNNKKIS